jgi:glycosyltransferase involved in cell wall biosynthesis
VIEFSNDVFNTQSFGGISRYFSELIGHFGPETAVMQGLFHRNTHLKNKAPWIGTYFDLPDFRGSARIYGFVNKIGARELPEVNLFIPTHYSAKPKSRQVPTVVTVFDMITELFPDQFSARNITVRHKRNAVESASHVIAISNNTKSDLCRLYDYPEEKVTVINLGVTDGLLIDRCDSTSGRDKIVLFVGWRWGYKNWKEGVRALAMNSELAEYRMLCVGGGGPTAEEHAFLSSLSMSSRVSFQQASDQQLWDFYRKSALLLYPSLHEGWGIPIAEAQALDCPVVAVNCSSIPEVADERAFLADTGTANDLAAKLLEALSTPRHREFVSRPPLLWSEVANFHRSIYDEVAVRGKI